MDFHGCSSQRAYRALAVRQENELMLRSGPCAQQRNNWYAFEYANQHFILNTEDGRVLSRLVPKAIAEELSSVSPSSCCSPSQKLQSLCADLCISISDPGNRKADMKRFETNCSGLEHLDLMIAQECNMRCIYCYGDQGRYLRPGMMGKDTALRAADWFLEQAGSAEEISLSFFGGEPMMNKALVREIVEHLTARVKNERRRIQFGISTNLSLLDNAFVSFIHDNNVKVLIGFDGPPEIQNRNRPFRDMKPSYDRVMKNFEALAQKTPSSVFLRPTISRTDDLPQVVDFFWNSSVPNFHLGFASPCVINPEANRNTSIMFSEVVAGFIKKTIFQLIRYIEE